MKYSMLFCSVEAHGISQLNPLILRLVCLFKMEIDTLSDLSLGLLGGLTITLLKRVKK